LYIPPSKLYKPNTSIVKSLLEDGEVPLAMLPIGMNSKILTNRRLLFLDALDTKVKEYLNLSSVEKFEFGNFAGVPKLDAVMKDGSKIKIGSLDQKWLEDVRGIFSASLTGEGVQTLEFLEQPIVTSDVSDRTVPTQMNSGFERVRTNSQKEFPKWLQKSIHDHKRENEQLLMVITEPYTNHQGSLLVFSDRCMIVKGGLMGGFMAGSLGGERAGTFYFTQITGIEYNSGMINGVLEILTPSYQGTKNKDFWQGTTKSRNADSNDPWTLNNCLPLTKEGYKTAREMIDELKDMIAEAQGARSQIPAPQISVAEEIAKLGNLLSQGLISEQEFTQAKQRLLG